MFFLFHRTYFKEERQQKLEEETSKVALKRDADELALLLAMNDQWNAHTAKLRYVIYISLFSYIYKVQHNGYLQSRL